MCLASPVKHQSPHPYVTKKLHKFSSQCCSFWKCCTKCDITVHIMFLYPIMLRPYNEIRRSMLSRRLQYGINLDLEVHFVTARNIDTNNINKGGTCLENDETHTPHRPCPGAVSLYGSLWRNSSSPQRRRVSVELRDSINDR